MVAFAVTGMTPTGEERVECDKASEAVAELNKMRRKAINCEVRDGQGRLMKEEDLTTLVGMEKQNSA